MGARRGGGARVGRPPPIEKKRSSLTILGAFLLLFLHMGPFLLLFFSFLGAFSPCGGLFATFYFMVGAFFGACPPPLRKFLRAPMIALLKFALNNVIVVRCNLLSFGVNFDKILLNKNNQKRIIFIYNNDIAAARVELWSSSTNAKYAESSSTNYILCKKQIKV